MKRGVHFPKVAFGLGTIEILRRRGDYGHALHYCREVRRLIRRHARILTRHQEAFNRTPRF